MVPIETLAAAAILAATGGTMPLSDATREFVYVCTDAGAGGYEAFPDVCRLSDGRLLCVFYAGWQHVSLPDEAHPRGGRIAGCWSADEGRTWSPAFTIHDGPHDDRDPSVVQLPDGRLLCTFFSLRAKEGGGHVGLGSRLVESADGGATWSAARPLAAEHYCSSPVRVLRDGRLIVGLYHADENDAWGAVALSDDGGRRWTPPSAIPHGGARLDAETDVIELIDGRLYAMQRSQQEEMRSSLSTDGGATWSPSVPVGFPGHCPYLHRTPSGNIVCAHRKPDTSLHVSTDECATWGETIVVDSVPGAYPSLANLADGSTLIVYYEEGPGSSIRARRFRATAGGIEWLPL